MHIISIWQEYLKLYNYISFVSDENIWAGESGVLLYCHYFQVHSDLHWLVSPIHESTLTVWKLISIE